MFEIEGDLILFNGAPVARFEPGVWATLRGRVVAALADVVSEDERDRLNQEYWDAGYDQGYKEGKGAV